MGTGLKKCVAVMILGLGALCAGCTAYVPKSGPRVAETTEGYHRGAEVIPHGFLDSGLVNAVSGNREAEEYAKSYRSLQIGGFVLDMVGLPLMVGGAFTSSDHLALAVGLLGGGAGLVLIGGILQGASGPAKLDAINAYNDGVLGLGPASPPPAASAAPSAPEAHETSGCTKDVDCKGDRICVRAACIDGPKPRKH